jgi:predicted MFS family arabinose efflux permease
VAKQPNTYIALSGLVFQMAAIIAGATYFGHYLDNESEGSTYTVIFSLIGVGLAMYVAIKEVISISKRK